ncbi:hypothetical protein EDD17DRAFT_1737726, partial [Pisolithus thermaeus]
MLASKYAYLSFPTPTLRLSSGLRWEPLTFENVRKTLKVYPEFRTLHLTHDQDVNENRREFTLDDKHALH